MSAAATFCANLVDEWVRLGVQHAVVAPGSRSTPMAVALAFMRYRVFTYRERSTVAAEPSGAQPRWQRRPAIAARYRTRTVQLPEFMRLNALERTGRRARLQ